MKPEITLKELLKPPFYIEDGEIYCKARDGKTYFICASAFAPINDFIIQTLNEKAEREWGEPMQREHFVHDSIVRSMCTGRIYVSCPCCGVKLLLTEGDV